MNLARIKAIEKKNKYRILKLCAEADENSGIYIFYRTENGFNFAYVGQAKHLLTRLANHLSGYGSHIDLSIRKHGLYTEDNPSGYKIKIIHFPEEELDEREVEQIKAYAAKGFQLRNKTSGGQGKGKFGIADNKPARGYNSGLRQGYKNAQRDVAKLFKNNLAVKCAKAGIRAENALNKFNKFIQGE